MYIFIYHILKIHETILLWYPLISRTSKQNPPFRRWFTFRCGRQFSHGFSRCFLAKIMVDWKSPWTSTQLLNQSQSHNSHGHRWSQFLFTMLEIRDISWHIHHRPTVMHMVPFSSAVLFDGKVPEIIPGSHHFLGLDVNFHVCCGHLNQQGLVFKPKFEQPSGRYLAWHGPKTFVLKGMIFWYFLNWKR